MNRLRVATPVLLMVLLSSVLQAQSEGLESETRAFICGNPIEPPYEVIVSGESVLLNGVPVWPGYRRPISKSQRHELTPMDLRQVEITEECGQLWRDAILSDSKTAMEDALSKVTEYLRSQPEVENVEREGSSSTLEVTWAGEAGLEALMFGVRSDWEPKDEQAEKERAARALESEAESLRGLLSRGGVIVTSPESWTAYPGRGGTPRSALSYGRSRTLEEVSGLRGSSSPTMFASLRIRYPWQT